LLEERLHRAEGCIGESAAKTLRHVARLVAMLFVEEGVECRVAGLSLRLGRSAEEAMSLGELDRVSKHV
jgi:hypothetical protein